MVISHHKFIVWNDVQLVYRSKLALTHKKIMSASFSFFQSNMVKSISILRLFFVQRPVDYLKMKIYFCLSFTTKLNEIIFCGVSALHFFTQLMLLLLLLLLSVVVFAVSFLFYTRHLRCMSVYIHCILLFSHIFIITAILHTL